MSATDQIRALLDEYMGTTRNGGETKIEFDNPRVCKSYLLDCCPNEILSGTRLGLGNCAFIHDPGLKADYRNNDGPERYQFELDALVHLEAFIRECDHRTEIFKAKLKETQDELTDDASRIVEQINGYSEQIGTKLARAEQLGAAGHVEESLKLMKAVEELNQSKEKCEAELSNVLPINLYQQRRLRICDVCSAYLGVHDNDRRLADHFGGKLHLGFIEIRTKLENLRKYIIDNNVLKKRKCVMAKRLQNANDLERQKEKEIQILREKELEKQEAIDEKNKEEKQENEKELKDEKEGHKSRSHSKSPSKSRSKSRSRSRSRSRLHHKKRHHSSRHKKKHSRSHRQHRSKEKADNNK